MGVMRIDLGGPGGNYIAKVRKFVEAHPELTGYNDVDIQHDHWCGVFKGRACNCDPDISLRRQD